MRIPWAPRLLAAVFALALSTLASDSVAFCGFYVSGADASLFNNATNVVLMRDGQRTVLSMQNNYQGPPQDFAMVVPVPVVLKKEHVKTLPKEVFTRIDKLAAPRLVEYWEQNPCQPPYPMEAAMMPAPAPAGAAMEEKSAKAYGVKIEAKFSVGEYDILILSASDSVGLDGFLRAQHYKIPAGAERYLRPYVAGGSKFFVAKVNIAKVKFEKGQAMLSPLRFHYDQESFSLPVRLGLINSQGAQDLIVHILARSRYEVANYENYAIPTNIDVKDMVKEKFGAFYAALFDRVLVLHPKAVITEYSWDAGSCDPCPEPPLEPSELATLGADALPAIKGAVTSGEVPPDFASSMTLTRLHVRYGKDSLGEDLVFRSAPPITGGRGIPDEKGNLPREVQPDSSNNFQGRYVIRHPWKGPIACENPRRGIWGGPTEPVADDGKLQIATDTAFAPRGGVNLGGMLSAPVPELGKLPSGPTEGAPWPPSVRGSGCAGCTMIRAKRALPAGLLVGGLIAALVARRRRGSLSGGR